MADQARSRMDIASGPRPPSQAMPGTKQDALRGLVAKAIDEAPIDLVFPAPHPFAGEPKFTPRRDGVGIAAADEGEGALLRGVSFQCFVT